MSITDQIHNYYEHKVVEVLAEETADKGFSQDQLVDIACLALNNLPTRYYRHEVDIAFYMSAHEHEEINRRTRQAVKDAVSYLKSKMQD